MKAKQEAILATRFALQLMEADIDISSWFNAFEELDKAALLVEKIIR